MVSNSLTTKLQQKFAPSQIQYMKLLQLPSSQLEDRLKEEIEKNPLLEEEEKKEEQIEIPHIKTDTNGRVRTKNAEKKTEQFKTDPGSFNSQEASMYENLMEQLGLVDLPELEYEIGKEIIGNINDNGYLTRTADAIVDDFFFSHSVEISQQQVEKILRVIQNFDPAGVGARDLNECLQIQIRRTKLEGKEIDLARRIILNESLFDMFKNKQYVQLLGKLSCSEEELEKAENVIRGLNPKPYSGSEGIYDTVYVTPDFYVWNNNGKVEFQLTKTFNRSVKLSPHYLNMLESLQKDSKKKENKEAIAFIKGRIDAANEFMTALSRRDETLTKVMAAVIKFNYAYFLDGDITKLKPMRLIDIARMTDNDISTISRFASNKYAQTHFGLFQIKRFFSNAVEDGEGNQIASDTIKEAIAKIIADEDKKKPLTDDKIVELLKNEGYLIARRTVAKYRDMLNLPVARLRKTIL
ncbi:MAG: RNA polymerase factor sigma-54 [Bacteroidales bacterium]|nr:RNA polymerase factor sigma-54 [Bacteroidales bacterium]